jgi:hypothetical protein
MTGDLFCIKVQTHRPRTSAVAIKYRGHWFYIDESDQDSRATFDLPLELFNLEIRAGGRARIP